MSRAFFHEVLHSTAQLLFPQLCEGCRSPLLYRERVLCMSCTPELPQTRFHHIADNEAALRLAGRIPYQHATAFAYFTPDGLLQHLLHRLKYSGRKDVGKYLGAQAGYALQAASWTDTIDVIVPVPLHPKKLAARGFNQSAVIAAGLAEILQRPVQEQALLRLKYTESQTQKSREERIVNVKDAFSVSPQASLGAKHVLLLDDVLTTGATLEAAAAALLKVPGLKLSVCSIGLAMN